MSSTHESAQPPSILKSSRQFNSSSTSGSSLLNGTGPLSGKEHMKAKDPSLPNGVGPRSRRTVAGFPNEVQVEIHYPGYYTNRAETQLLNHTADDTTFPQHRAQREGDSSDQAATETSPVSDSFADFHQRSSMEEDQIPTDQQVGLNQWPVPPPLGLSSYTAEPEDFAGGEGSRLKNRTGSRATSRYMPVIQETKLTGEEDKTPGSNASLSNNSSFSTTYSNYVMSSTGSGNAPHGSGKGPSDQDTLTVEGTWKVEKAMKEKQNKRTSKVKMLAIAKWVGTVLMAGALLICLVSVKLSVLELCTQLWQNLPSQGEDSQEDWSRYSAQFIVLYIFLSVPALVMLLRSTWYGFLDKTVPWPRKKAVLLAVMSAGAESLGVCVMCYSVLGRYQAPLSLMLPATVLLVPSFNTVFIVRDLRQQERVKPRTATFALIGALCQALGLLGAGVVLVESATIDADIWHLGLAFICLSVAWLPSLQHFIGTAHSSDKPRQQDSQQYGTFNNNHGDINTNNGISATMSTASSAQTSTTTTTSTATAATADEVKNRSGDLSSNPAWKTAFIVNGCRLLFIFFFSALLFMLDSGQSPSDVLTSEVHEAFLDSWDLSTYVQGSSTWVAFWLGLGAGFGAYILAYAACHMNMAVGALAPPLLLATPVAVAAVAVSSVCEDLLPASTCAWDEGNVMYVVPTVLCLMLGHVMSFGWYLFRVDPVLLQQECLVFCVPGLNGMSLDTWLTLNRRHDVSVSVALDKKSWKKTKVFICTTMYREEEDEMRQLLESIAHINEAQACGDRYFESHIIFDNGVRQKELSEFALALIALLDETLGVEPKACTKVTTPYGLKLSWALPGPIGQRMAFNIHLKDNLLVKNKKRWSQVMYMSYVLDFLSEAEDEAYILTTDADVVFTPDSVEALLDLMTRDNSIGAVCARTHPMGGGPLVWYQVFEYAIGHWFQKTAEHVLGSVLCAPGCFSVYRCKALADVLPKYAKRVETAFDFLTKDMGEDRWLCTLLVQSGWRIEYCAASENSTNCPGHFDEFYKQRRRWIASTLANLMLIVKEWKYVHLLNHRVSVIFLLYQGLLLFSTLIGPSTVMLVVSGGLSYAWDMDGITTVVIQLLACVAYALLCVFTTQPTQLQVAKVYTFIYAVVMTAVVVGTAEQIVDDLSSGSSSSAPPSPPNGSTTTTTQAPNQHISVDLPVSVTTLYFTGLVVIFVTAGILHPREIYCLMHGVWYLLCLPSGYLVLTIYSICNITDSSWGTREQAAEKSAVKKAPWQERLQIIFFEIFFCCNKKSPTTTASTEVGVQTYMPRSTSVTLTEDSAASLVGQDEHTGTSASADLESSQEVIDEIPDETEPIPVEEWLPLEMRGRYAHLFRKHGFDSTLFIAGMTETELRRIGVTTKGHLHYLLAQIALIPAFEIEYKVPTNAGEWLDEIGLPMYRDNFWRNHIRQPKEMEILKSFGRREIERELGVIKDGHIKRMKYAISMLRDPTEAQQKAIRMRQMIDEAPMHNLGEFNVGENDFWETLKLKCLQPDLKAFGLEGEVKVKLAHLRNDWLLILAVSNTLWLILISTLASKSTLTVLGANPLGLVFLFVFGSLFSIQFLTMLLHRFYTLSHYLARAPYKCGKPMTSSWAFASNGHRRQDYEDTVDFTAVQQVKRDAQRAWDRVLQPKRKSRRSRHKTSSTEQITETTALMP